VRRCVVAVDAFQWLMGLSSRKFASEADFNKAVLQRVQSYLAKFNTVVVVFDKRQFVPIWKAAEQAARRAGRPHHGPAPSSLPVGPLDMRRWTSDHAHQSLLVRSVVAALRECDIPVRASALAAAGPACPHRGRSWAISSSWTPSSQVRHSR
jgi:hypothetical protein